MPLKQAARLTGNYGELRPNHFHSGLDLATGSAYVPVVAIADGYLYRVKSSTYGYGNTVHIHHSTGHTSLYAHLSAFGKKILPYIDSLRYHYQDYEIDCYLGKDSIFIKQGDTIGTTGNTGASLGAHLHFEIRNTNLEVPLNPLLFFNLADPIRPVIRSIVAVPLTVNGEINEHAAYTVIKSPPVLKKSSKSRKSKRKSKKRRKGGYDDDYLISSCLPDYHFDTELFSNHLIVSNSNKRLPENQLEQGKKKKKKATTKKKNRTKKRTTDIKKTVVSKLQPKPNSTIKDIAIDTSDQYSKVVLVPNKFGVQISTYDSDLGGSSNNVYSIAMYLDSVLKVSVYMDSMSFEDLRYINTYLDHSGKGTGQMQRLFKTKHNDLPLYKTISDSGYLQLRDTSLHFLKIVVKDVKGNSDSSISCIKWNGQIVAPHQDRIAWDCNSINVYQTDEITVGTAAKTFYQDVVPLIYPIRIERSLQSTVFQIFNDKVFLHKWISIGIKPKLIADSLKDKLCLVQVIGKSMAYIPSALEGNKVFGLVRKSGIYAIALDTVGPKVKPLFLLAKLKSKVLKFAVSDNLSGIKQFKLFINEVYVQAMHESKANLIFYNLQHIDPQNIKTIRLEVIDHKGNQSNIFI